MELSKGKILTRYLDGKEDLRFELFDWLKAKRLNVREAVELLEITGLAIEAASHDQNL